MMVVQDDRGIKNEYLIRGREFFFPGHRCFS
jgi:hypothetical protein